MLQRLREAGLIWPTVATVVALGVLVSLGTWQVQRKQWKDGLIAKIAARTQAAPIELPSDEALIKNADREYLHVTASGHFLHDKERYLYAPTPLGLGWHVFTPLATTSGELVWVNRGFATILLLSFIIFVLNIERKEFQGLPLIGRFLRPRAA